MAERPVPVSIQAKKLEFSSRITADLELDLKTISSWYKEKDSFCGLLENSSAGLNYQIFLGCGTSSSTNSLGLIVIGAKVATAKFNIEITNDQKKSLQIADKKERHAQLDDQIAIFEVKLPNFEGKVETLIGIIGPPDYMEKQLNS